MGKNGNVFIIGAGPGDPELITVKGMKRLKEADCILYDFLSAPELLGYAKEGCEQICVGKADGMHLKEQPEINALLAKKAREHATVVRLKGGDPFIFSRGCDEAKFLLSQNIPFEVIQGITSALAAPASFGIPLTVKGTLSSVAIVTGRHADKNAPIEAPATATVIYLMGVSNCKNIVAALLMSGRNPETPCAFIERGTCETQRIIRGTIGTIEDEVLAHNVQSPAVLIVGDVLTYAIPEQL